MLDLPHLAYSGFTNDELDRTHAWIAARRHLLISQYKGRQGLKFPGAVNDETTLGPTARNTMLVDDLRRTVAETTKANEHTVVSGNTTVENLAVDNEVHLETIALLDELVDHAQAYVVGYRKAHINPGLSESEALASRTVSSAVHDRFHEITLMRDTVQHMLTGARIDALNAGLSPELLINDAALRIDLSDRFETSHEQTEHLEEIAAKVAEAKTIADNQAATVAEKTRQKKRQQRDGEMEL